MSPRRDTGISQHLHALKPPAEQIPDDPATEPPVVAAASPRAPMTSAPGERRGPGRPKGKKSDPEFRQHSVWLRKATHRQAMAYLRDADPDRVDFSDLVETLLTAWNKRQTK